MTSIPTPLVARFIRNYKSVYGVVQTRERISGKSLDMGNPLAGKR